MTAAMRAFSSVKPGDTRDEDSASIGLYCLQAKFSVGQSDGKMSSSCAPEPMFFGTFECRKQLSGSEDRSPSTDLKRQSFLSSCYRHDFAPMPIAGYGGAQSLLCNLDKQQSRGAQQCVIRPSDRLIRVRGSPHCSIPGHGPSAKAERCSGGGAGAGLIAELSSALAIRGKSLSDIRTDIGTPVRESINADNALPS